MRHDADEDLSIRTIREGKEAVSYMGLVTSARGALNEWTSPSAVEVQSAVVQALESTCVQEASENESQVWGTSPAGSLPEAASQIDEQQRQQLLLDHLPQVRHVARRIHFRLPPQVLLEDLVHAGVLGLIDAVRKYDPSKNVQLKYYAEFRIRGAILDSLRLADWSPRALRRGRGVSIRRSRGVGASLGAIRASSKSPPKCKSVLRVFSGS